MNIIIILKISVNYWAFKKIGQMLMPVPPQHPVTAV